MASVRKIRISGKWREGYALDYHTISSVYIGHDEYGHRQFDTTRSEIGELLYRLKYKSDQSVISIIAQAAAEFLRSWNPGIDLIVPVPPSRQRTIQPVKLIGVALGKRLKLPFITQVVRKTGNFPELKNIYGFEQRLQLLTGAFHVNKSKVQDSRILLFDDLYRSGATMNVVTSALFDQGGAADVFALTITRTRRHS